jgi:hypothetical protein
LLLHPHLLLRLLPQWPHPLLKHPQPSNSLLA